MSLVTTVVGTYPQPEWLIDRDRLDAPQGLIRHKLEHDLPT